MEWSPGGDGRVRNEMLTLRYATVLSEIEKDTAARNQRKHNRSKAPEPSPPPPPPTAKTVSTPEPGADAAPAQEQPKGRTAYFF